MLELAATTNTVEEDKKAAVVDRLTTRSSDDESDFLDDQPPSNDDTIDGTTQATQQQQQQQQQRGVEGRGIIKRKLLLITPLILCLYMLTDTTYHVNTTTTNNSYNNNNKQHLAFITALSRHPPSLRIFRIVSESAFLLLCTALALWVWEGNCSDSCSRDSSGRNECDEDATTTTRRIRISSHDVGQLLFGLPPNSITDNVAYRLYKTHRHRRMGNRNRRRSSMRRRGRRRKEEDDGERVGEQDDVDYRQHEVIRDEEEEEINENNDVNNNKGEGLPPPSSSLMMDPQPSPRTIRKNAYNLLNQLDQQDHYGDDDDEYDDNDNRHATSTTNEEEEATLPKPPTSTSVLGAAIDITTFMCMFLIFFTISSAEGGRYIDHTVRGGINISPNNNQDGENDSSSTINDENEISYMKFFARIAAPLFPITLFILSLVLLIIPWRKRKTLWTVVSLTIGAPFYEVTFRDGFIGDILTSTVRPLQDLAYTIVFLFLGLQAFWDDQSYNNTVLEDVPAIERSWILHTIILPACTLSPLWWRFLQNLRQCYDTKRRWPYLGNAFKYMLAAEVAIFGMFDPSLKKNWIWIICFGGATLYQVWWDVFMDWGLLEWNMDNVVSNYYHGSSTTSSSRNGLFWWWPYQLRVRRAYQSKWMYYTIFLINFCLRFVGMLTLLPPVYLSRSTGLIVNTWYDPDFQLFVGSLAASAEIFRRTIWALLRLEWEVIKTSSSSSSSPVSSTALPLITGKGMNGNGIPEESENDPDSDLNDLLHIGDKSEMKPMAISSSSESDGGAGGRRRLNIQFLGSRKGGITLESLSDMSNLNDIQILSELCAWATIFSGIAIIAAAHREVL